MEKEILKISNGYLLTMDNKTEYYSDFATCIVNAFMNEFGEMQKDETKQLFIKSELL